MPEGREDRAPLLQVPAATSGSSRQGDEVYEHVPTTSSGFREVSQAAAFLGGMALPFYALFPIVGILPAYVVVEVVCHDPLKRPFTDDVGCSG